MDPTQMNDLYQMYQTSANLILLRGRRNRARDVVAVISVADCHHEKVVACFLKDIMQDACRTGGVEIADESPYADQQLWTRPTSTE